MAAFNFRLQKLLTYRRMLVEQLRLDLAALERSQQHAAALLLDLRRAERGALEEAGKQRTPVLNLPAIIQTTSYLDSLRTRITRQTAAVHDIGDRVNAVRADLETVARRAKALEKLKDGDVEEHLRGARRQELIDTGEVAALQYRRAQEAR